MVRQSRAGELGQRFFFDLMVRRGVRKWEVCQKGRVVHIGRRGTLGGGARKEKIRKTYDQRGRTIRVGSDGGEWVARSCAFGPQQSSFDAELRAIVYGLEVLTARDSQGSESRAFTGPQAAVQRLRSDAPGPGQSLARRRIRLEQATVS